MSALVSVPATKKVRLQNYVPNNLEAEKRKFLFDPLYNPQFVYTAPVSLDANSPIEETYVAKCQAILQSINKQFGSHEAYQEATRGRVLPRETIMENIQQYLEANSLTKVVTVETSAAQVARTSVIGHTLRLRLPLEYNEYTLPGILRHEIGTHIFRRLNDEQQPWAHQRQHYQLLPYTMTEEGLAVLHAHIFQDNRWLAPAALSYYAGWYGNHTSFAGLYKELGKFTTDPEQRWHICLRVKRGQTDTSQPGSFSHSQIYFRGVMQVAQWLVEHDYDVPGLYLGKIDCADVAKCRTLSAIETPLLPGFAKDHDRYRQEINQIIKTNKLELG
jgi:hypothetical protein